MAKEDMLKYYQAIGTIQSSINKSSDVYEALKGSIAAILKVTESDVAVVW